MLTDESAGANDAVVSTPVHHEILHDREGTHAEGFDGDGLPILELAHVDLTGGSATGSLGNSVDDHVTCSANSLATIAGKGNRLLTLPSETVVDDIEHL